MRFQGYLAGSAVALLLAAQVAMELLHAYPVNQYLWHVNIIFAREARPLLQQIDAFAGGSSAVTVFGLGGFALLCIAAGHARIRLLAIVNSHIVLIMFLFLAGRSYSRTYPYGLPSNGTLISLATEVSVVQLGMAVFVAALAAVCVLSQVETLGRCFARCLALVRAEGAGRQLLETGLALLRVRQVVPTEPRAP